MDDLLIVGGAIALLLLWKGGGSASVSVAAAAPANGVIPYPTSISGGALVSGGYQIAPAGITVGAGLAPATPSNAPTFVPPAPIASPPPPYVGGAPGTVGSGGIGFGAFRLGAAPLLGSNVPGWSSWLVRHRLPDHSFGRSPGLSRVPVVFG